MTDLKNCPFCGGANIAANSQEFDSHWRRHIRCVDCDYSMSEMAQAHGDAVDAAERKWNTRSTPDLARVREFLEEIGSAGGKYPYVNGTMLVADSREILRLIDTAKPEQSAPQAKDAIDDDTAIFATADAIEAYDIVMRSYFAGGMKFASEMHARHYAMREAMIKAGHTLKSCIYPAEQHAPAVTIPQTEAEAELMQKVGYAWLKEYAPHRLSANAGTVPDDAGFTAGLKAAYDVTKKYAGDLWRDAEAENDPKEAEISQYAGNMVANVSAIIFGLIKKATPAMDAGGENG